MPGVVTVTVAAGDKVVRVEVTDQSGDDVPILPSAAPAEGEAEGAQAATGGRAVSTVGHQCGGRLATI
jgi:hypothetical protein